MTSSSAPSRTFIGLAIVLLLGVGGIGAGCDVSFDPFIENQQFYSISGYLDVRQDTQFVRVERLRDSLLYESKPLPATVTLEHLGTEQTWTWQDSLFRFGLDQRAHNFWATAPILPRETYRFSVRGPDGRRSAATVTLPDTFSNPQVVSAPTCLELTRFCTGKIYVDVTGIETLAALQAIYYYTTDPASPQECRQELVVDYLPEVQSIEEGFRGALDWREELEQLDNVKAFIDVALLVAAGGPGWPEAATIANADAETLFLPGNRSNVEGGVGFLGGVATKVVDVFPPQDCKGDAQGPSGQGEG